MGYFEDLDMLFYSVSSKNGYFKMNLWVSNDIERQIVSPVGLLCLKGLLWEVGQKAGIIFVTVQVVK